MSRTKRTPPRVDTSRETLDELTVNGRHVHRGDELTITPGAVPNLRGRVAFVRYVRHVDGAEWVDVLDKRGRSRSVRPDAIRTVHRHATGILAVARGGKA